MTILISSSKVHPLSSSKVHPLSSSKVHPLSSSKSFIEDQVTCHPQKHTHCHPHKHTHCHPQLDWGSSVYFFSFNRSNKYFLDSRFRGNDKELTVILESTPTVILEIFYRGSRTITFYYFLSIYNLLHLIMTEY